MGVADLLKLCKQGASLDVSFTRGDGNSLLLVDGGFMLHKVLSWARVAAALHAGNAQPLMDACVKFVQRFREAGWVVFVVFDGISPPAKLRTATERLARRQEAEGKLLDPATSESDRTKLVKQCVGLDARTREKVSRAIKARCESETVIAPYEADAQLVVMEKQMGANYDRCFIHANDSDIIILGGLRVAWNITTKGDELVGQVIFREVLLNPPRDILADQTRGDFLRKLHAVPLGCENSLALDEEAAEERLLHLAIVSRHDYQRYNGVGCATALKIALPPLDEQIACADNSAAGAGIDRLAALVAEVSGTSQVDVRRALQVSVTMFRHSVVFDMHIGLQRRQHKLPMDSIEAETEASVSTGAGSPSAVGACLGQSSYYSNTFSKTDIIICRLGEKFQKNIKL